MQLKISRPHLLWASYAVLLIATVVVLRSEGRSWWCACSGFALWEGDIWSSHDSQHLVDPYSFTHVLHGVLFCWGAWILLPKITVTGRLWITTAIECLWEILENSEFIIQRYRAVTVSLGYHGDSVINSLGDIGCCVLGFGLAHYFGFRRSLVAYVTTELLLLVTIRDNLTLNVLMLVWPVEAVKTWQMVP